VHGTVDTDVPPEYSDFALEHIAGAEILRVEHGTHIATWTDATSDEIQRRIIDFIDAATA
jgi:pimeloyl-ACP methyl ester carboxylesterase